MGEEGLYGEFQKTMGDLEHGYLITTDPPIDEGEKTKLFNIGYTEGLSRNLKRACANSPMPLCHEIG